MTTGGLRWTRRPPVSHPHELPAAGLRAERVWSDTNILDRRAVGRPQRLQIELQVAESAMREGSEPCNRVGFEVAGVLAASPA